MPPRLLQGRFILPIFLALATTLLSLPKAEAQTPPSKAHKVVLVTVDYVDVPLADLLKASQWIASGPAHDGLLMAALLKGGAKDTSGMSVTSGDYTSMQRGESVPTDAADNGQFPAPYIYRSAGAVPQFNTDGTVTIALQLEFGVRTDTPLPPHPGYQYVIPTFRDGQTLEIGRSITQSQVGVSFAHLTFVRAEIMTSNSVKEAPGAAYLRERKIAADELSKYVSLHGIVEGHR